MNLKKNILIILLFKMNPFFAMSRFSLSTLNHEKNEQAASVVYTKMKQEFIMQPDEFEEESGCFCDFINSCMNYQIRCLFGSMIDLVLSVDEENQKSD